MVQIPRWQTIAVVVILLLGLVYALPNVLPRFDTESLPGWVPHKTVSLGLDLQGGSYLLMEVDIEAAFEQELEDLEQRLRLDFRAAKVLFRNLGVSGGRLQVDLVNVEQLAEARTIVIEAAQGFDVEVSDEGRFEVRFAELTRDGRATSILNQAIEIIRLRLDETGTREPSIQRQGDDRILVQLPGVDDPQRIKDLLGTPAVMTFRFVDETASPIVGISLLNAPRHTPLYERLSREGRLTGDDFSGEWQLETNIVPKQMTREELARGVWELFGRIYDPELFDQRLQRWLSMVEYHGEKGYATGKMDLQEAWMMLRVLGKFVFGSDRAMRSAACGS